MTSACQQKRDGEVTPSAYDGGDSRPGEWGHPGHRRHGDDGDLSFPGEDDGQRGDDDDGDGAERLEEDNNEAIVNTKVASSLSLSPKAKFRFKVL